ncbi:MAG: dTDP-glucose 4,6-dehydratase [Methanoregula sp. PtaU1.Bin051]|nr:MAG: dTDP-glucose 4,6-dehydratase [Methanoregula sp. PtaU1.Bin051]
MEDMERLNFWKGKRVLVTGATGVVGTNLTNRLVKYSAEITAVVRDWIPQNRMLGTWASADSPVILVRGGLEDFNFIERVIAEYECEYIFHLGAQTIVQVGNASPVTTFKANIEGTWNLLEAARIVHQYGSQIKAICVASSDKAYGESTTLPYTEEMPLAGQHPYDVSKSCTDLLARSYAKTYSLPVMIARMGNIYGPYDLNFNRIIPGTIRQILNNERPVIRSDGTPIREYFFVEDAVDAYLTMAMKAGSVLNGEAFNFSSGEKKRVIDVVRQILTLMNSDLEPVIKKTGRNEIQDQYLSIEKAKRVLLWKPTYTLSKGLPVTIEWYRELYT